jgi:carboxypeptidase family protein
MKLWWRIVWVGFALVVASQGQSSPAPLTIGFQKTVEVPIAGATAAYSLNSAVAEGRIDVNGAVQIYGKRPGTTNIVVVTTAGVQSILVVVPVPVPVYPPGFGPPLSEGSTVETGSYEVRYSSDPSQVTNSLELKRSQGESFERLQIVNANFFSATSSTSRIGFPLASYEISRRNWGVILLDQTVDNSPLTLDRAVLRGLHIRWGDWQFHGGVTTVATFQGLFLLTDPEEAFGVSRFFHLTKNSSLEANLYYFKNPASQLDVAPNGVVGSLVYRLKHKDKLDLLSELGFGRGVAFAVRGTYDDKDTHFIGSFRIEPKRFASLAVSNQHGTFADLTGTRNFTPRLYASVGLSESNYNLPALNQDTFTSTTLMNFRLTQQLTASAGGTFSRFSSSVPTGPTLNTLSFPVGIDYSTRHFGSGFQYQRTTNFDGSGGNDFAVNARTAWGHFQGSAFFRHDVNVPTLAAVFAQIPGLQDLLVRDGIVVTSPDQLAQLLRDTALLATLGFTGPLTVDLAPSRNDSGASFGWISSGASHRQLNVNFFNSDTQLIQGKLTFTTGVVSYSQRLGKNNDLVASAGMFRTVTNGTSSFSPALSISLQHRFSSVPSFLLPGRHGVIEGHVFRDDESSGQYSGKQTAVAGMEVLLDGDRTTHTDASGYYSFHHVPFGAHKVEAKFQSPEPFFYTTDSPATANMNATVDFGINFAKGQVYGFLLNDAGQGVPGVTVELRGAGAPRTAQTTADGKFSFLGLEAGDYSAHTVAETYPPGYALQDLQPKAITVGQGQPGKIEFSVRAIRVISGKVMVYDKTLLTPVPLANAVVRLKEISAEVRTGANGAYIFRNLPAGVYTIAAEYQGKETVRVVTVPAAPANLRDIDIDAGAK